MADDQDNGLSDEEYDALLQDLEGRAAEGGGEAPDVDPDEEVGDLDEILESEMADAEPEPATKTESPEDSEFAEEFAALEQEHGGELEVSGDSTPDLDDLDDLTGTDGPEGDSEDQKQQHRHKKKPKPDDTEAEQEDGEAAQAPSRGRRIAKFVGLNALWVVPALAMWWVVGSYLGQWVSAGWLIAVVGAMFVFVVPWLLRRAVDRGYYRAWVGGLSLVATIGLIAPMPNMAADRIAQYGHWPSATVAEIAQQDRDADFVRVHGATAGWIGQMISTTEADVPQSRQLGTIIPLGVEWPPEEAIPALQEGEVPEFEDPTEPQEADEPAPADQADDEPAPDQEAQPEIEDQAGPDDEGEDELEP